MDTNTEANDSQDKKWWLVVDEEAEGPYGEEYLFLSLKSNRISTDALLCPVGGDEWKCLAEWPDFAELIEETPPPAVRSPLIASRQKVASILTNQQLPTMGNAICIYCLVVFPAIVLMGWLVSILTGSNLSQLPRESPIRIDAIVLTLGGIIVDVAITTMVVCGGLWLLKLRRAGSELLKAVLLIDLSWQAVLLLTSATWGALITLSMLQQSGQLATEPELSLTGQVFLVSGGLIQFASCIFEFVALMWLFRRGESLPVTND